jgi:hypothetical protein
VFCAAQQVYKGSVKQGCGEGVDHTSSLESSRICSYSTPLQVHAETSDLREELDDGSAQGGSCSTGAVGSMPASPTFIAQRDARKSVKVRQSPVCLCMFVCVCI